MKPIQLTVFIIWFALCAGLVVYAGLLRMMTFEPATAAGSSTTGVFALVAGIAAALSFVLRQLFLGGFRTGIFSLDEPSGSGRYVTGHILVFAFSESVGVLGFVNGINARGEMDAWLPFIGGSLILLLLHIPLPGRFTAKQGGYQR